MQQINPSDAQRVDDRGTYIGLHRASPVWPLLPGEKPKQPACTANRCSSGDKVCPCPTECQIPEPDAITAINTVLIVVCYLLSNPWTWIAIGVLSLAGGFHFVGRMGWLS